MQAGRHATCVVCLECNQHANISGWRALERHKRCARNTNIESIKPLHFLPPLAHFLAAAAPAVFRSINAHAGWCCCCSCVSTCQAIGIATASGLSEPVGALLALLFLKPFVRSTAALEYVLAATGGVMLAVCVLELWPEGQRCGRDGMLLAGVLLGTVVMGWTLHVGV